MKDKQNILRHLSSYLQTIYLDDHQLIDQVRQRVSTEQFLNDLIDLLAKESLTCRDIYDLVYLHILDNNGQSFEQLVEDALLTLSYRQKKLKFYACHARSCNEQIEVFCCLYQAIVQLHHPLFCDEQFAMEQIITAEASPQTLSWRFARDYGQAYFHIFYQRSAHDCYGDISLIYHLAITLAKTLKLAGYRNDLETLYTLLISRYIGVAHAQLHGGTAHQQAANWLRLQNCEQLIWSYLQWQGQHLDVMQSGMTVMILSYAARLVSLLPVDASFDLDQCLKQQRLSEAVRRQSAPNSDDQQWMHYAELEIFLSRCQRSTRAGDDVDNQLMSLLSARQINSALATLYYKQCVSSLYLFENRQDFHVVLDQLHRERDSAELRRLLYIVEVHLHLLSVDQVDSLIITIFEHLSHRSEDIRLTTAKLIGLSIAVQIDKYHKIHAIDESAGQAERQIIDLINRLLQRFLHLEVSLSARHEQWIGQSLKLLIESLMQHLAMSDRQIVSRLIVKNFSKYPLGDAQYSYIVATLPHLTLAANDHQSADKLLQLIKKMSLIDDEIYGLEALDSFIAIAGRYDAEQKSQLIAHFEALPIIKFSHVYHYLMAKLGSDQDRPQVYQPPDISSLYFSNLQTATAPIIKRLQVEMLSTMQLENSSARLIAAMHYSNVMRSSVDYRVRAVAGRALRDLFNDLTSEQQREIVFELLRALEVESVSYTRFVPRYLGELISMTCATDLLDIAQFLLEKVKISQPMSAQHILKVVANAVRYSLLTARHSTPSAIGEMCHVLLIGLVHYERRLRITTMRFIGEKLFAPDIALAQRRIVYQLLAKKLINLIGNIVEEQPTIAQAGVPTLYRIYNFIIEHRMLQGEVSTELPDKAAFYPGTFDPFSLAHRKVATMIRDQGFEVFLAVDEFSWSKRTQPNRIRREIVEMSIASEYHIYTYPKAEIVNIANVTDLKRLAGHFAEQQLYLVMGSDVLLNASAYRRDGVKNVLLSFSHIVFDRLQKTVNLEHETALCQILEQIKGDTIRLQLPDEVEHISSTQIRHYIDQNRDVSELIDPLVQAYIYGHSLYRHEPLFKDTMTIHSTSVSVVERPSEALLAEICRTFAIDVADLRRVLADQTVREATRLLLVRDLSQSSKIIAFSCFHWLRSSKIYHEFSSVAISDYIRRHAIGRISVIDFMMYLDDSPLKNLAQVILTETLAYVLAKDYTYAVYKQPIAYQKEGISALLEAQGFVRFEDSFTERIYAVMMTEPITLNLDVKAMLKAPYRTSPRVNQAIDQSRGELQAILTRFFPGHLVLSLDRTMMYEHLVEKICRANGVPAVESARHGVGPNMCVTYGDLFKRWRIPNTVTKALHTERFYTTDLTDYHIANHPNYLDMSVQVSTIKSFNRPTILIDDLLDKGKRLKLILEQFKREQIAIEKVIVGIMTGRGRGYLEVNNIEATAAYYIPKIRAWFNEAMLYPFIGGDAYHEQDKAPQHAALNAVNMILPYVFPAYLTGVNHALIAEFSKICLQNSQRLLTALETEYYALQGHEMTLNYLSDVFVSPRLPYRGKHLSYRFDFKPSAVVQEEIQQMEKLAHFYGEEDDE